MTEHTDTPITGTCKHCGRPFVGVPYYTPGSFFACPSGDPLVWKHVHNRNAYCTVGDPSHRAEDDRLWCNLGDHYRLNAREHLLAHMRDFHPYGKAEAAIDEYAREYAAEAIGWVPATGIDQEQRFTAPEAGWYDVGATVPGNLPEGSTRGIDFDSNPGEQP